MRAVRNHGGVCVKNMNRHSGDERLFSCCRAKSTPFATECRHGDRDMHSRRAMAALSAAFRRNNFKRTGMPYPNDASSLPHGIHHEYATQRAA
jgi:hypothetical protein